MPHLAAASRLGRVFVALLATAAFCVGPTEAQISPGSLDGLEQLRSRASRPAQQPFELPSDVVALEGPIDPATYVVGVGDVFGISIGGALPVQVAIPVSADGGLVVPDVGRIPAAGRTLEAVTAQVRTALRRSYRNVVTEVALAQPAPFLVHVGGAVPIPGRHPLPPMARTENAISAALGGISPLDAFATGAGLDARPALRSILLTRADGAVETVDLHAYYLTGDPAFNPILRGGDRLTVPAFDRARAVAVEGAVPFAGPFDLRPGDTAADLLRLAAGPAGVERIGLVQLARLTPEGGTRVFPLSPEAAADPAASVLLQPRDRIVVAPTERLRGAVQVEGEVAFPGGYPIESGRTTLAELLELAGGLTDEALPRAIFVERQGRESSDEAAPALTADRTSVLQEEINRAAETAEAVGRSGLPYSGRQFLATERARAPRLVIDLSDGAEAAGGVLLRDGDLVVVPEDPGGIRVAGQVVRPGLLPFAPGADAAYYVEQAGGLADGARAVYVQDAASGALRPAENATVLQGDLVFVDRRPVGDSRSDQQLLIQQEQVDLQEEQIGLQEERERREARFRFVSAGLQVVSTAVAVVTTYLLIQEANSN
jgi:protein involved in polysaccharide export with SLBB domain